MPSKYTLKLQKPDGSIKRVPWDRDEDPTPEEIDTLLSLPDPPKPGFLQGIIDPLQSMYEGIRDTGKSAAKHIKEGNYPAAFGDITSPVLHPFEGITGILTGNKPTNPGTELAGQAGIPLDMMKDSYTSGNYRRLAGQGLTSLAMLAGSAKGVHDTFGGPKIEAKPNLRLVEPPTVAPTIDLNLGNKPSGPKSFEALAKEPYQATNWMGTLANLPEHQAALPLEFNDALQPELKQQPRSAGMVGDKPEIHAFDALVPERYKSVEPSYPKIIGPKQPELFPNPSPETPVILESKQFDYDRPTWSKFAEQRELPLEYDTLSAAELSEVPEIQKAVKQVVEDAHSQDPTTTFNRKTGYSNPNSTQGPWSRAKDDWIKSNYSVLTQDSPAGRGIASMIDKYRTEVGRTSGEISTQLKEVVEPLTPEQFKQFQYYLDTGADIPSEPKLTVEDPNVGRQPKVNPIVKDHKGLTNTEMLNNLKEPPTPTGTSGSLPPEFSHMAQPDFEAPTIVDPQVRLALDVARDVDKKFTERAVKSGIHLKTSEGEIIPFTGKNNYWPRMYEHSLFADKPALLARLIKQGMAPEAAKKAVDNARRFGERLIDPQNQRVLDLPEHRKDFGALLKHYDDMAHRVVGAETFGVKDIADPNTPISQLVGNTKDPGRVTKILTNYLDRDTGVAPYEADVVKKISKYTTLFYLSKFALSNSNQLAFIPVVTDFVSTGKALKQFLSSPKNTWREAEGMGALQTVLQESMREVGGESTISKMYGIKASEGSNRTIAAIAGKHYVTDLFNKLQKNPNNTKALKSLSDLTLTSPEDLVKQTSLTDKQIAYGATRVAEKTQGRAQSIDLPYNWDKSPYMNLLLLYKKFAFVQGRLLKDALKTDSSQPFISKEGGLNINPRNAAILAALFQLSGEGTGDAKAAIKGLFTGDVQNQVQQRGQNLNMNPIMNRIVQNYIDSMFLGLLGDVAQSARGGKAGIMNFIGGPVIGGATDIAGNMISDAGRPKIIMKNPNKSNTLRGLASKTPFIGGAILEKMKANSR